MTLLGYGACKKLFESKKKESGSQFTYFDLSSQGQPYFTKLAEYGIYNREWQSIIHKINEEESGLSKLFSDCRDARTLTQKWFFPAIEDKLDHQGSQIKNTRSVFINYINDYRKNQYDIQQRDSIIRFLSDSAPLQDSTAAYVQAAREIKVCENQIGSYIKILQSLLADANQHITDSIEEAAALNAELLSLEYEQRSAEYHLEDERYEASLTTLSEIRKQLEQAQSDTQFHEKRLSILQCARKQAILDEEIAILNQALQALEVFRMEEAALLPEREYIGYQLKLYYETKLKDADADLADNLREIEANRSEKQVSAKRLSQKDQEEKTLIEEIGGLNHEIASHDEAEKRFSKRWHIQFVRDVLGEYAPGFLEETLEVLQTSHADSCQLLARQESELEETRKNIKLLDRKNRDLQSNLQEIQNKLNKLKETKALYDQEIEERHNILQHLELGEQHLFELSQILDTCISRISETDGLIADLTSKATDIQQQIERLNTGKTAELSPELLKMFESLNIHVVYGMEWLKKRTDKEDENLALVRRLPFLPYSILLTKSEWDLLEQSKKQVYTSSPVPIVLREALSMSEGSKAADDSPDHPRFYMLFNENLLNEERLLQMILDLQAQSDKLHTEINHRKEAHEQLILFANRIRQHTVTESEIYNVQVEIERLTSDIQAGKAEIAENQEKLRQLNANQEQLQKKIPKTKEIIHNLNLEIDDFHEVRQSYFNFRTALKKRDTLLEQREALEKDKKDLSLRVEGLNEVINHLSIHQQELQNTRTNLEKESIPFSSYEPSERPADMEADEEETFTFLQARYKAITEKASLQEKSLEKDRDQAEHRIARTRADLQDFAKHHDLSMGEWDGVNASSAQEDLEDSEIHRCRERQEEIRHALGAEEKNNARIEERKRIILNDIRKTCQKDVPMPKEQVTFIPYEKKRMR